MTTLTEIFAPLLSDPNATAKAWQNGVSPAGNSDSNRRATLERRLTTSVKNVTWGKISGKTVELRRSNHPEPRDGMLAL